MSTLASKYAKLKKRVGGNREKIQYEETFGMPQEEYFKVTMPNAWHRRILAETEFAIRLSKELEGKYDSEIEGALDFMKLKMDEEGVLTRATCEAAERMLMPLAEEAKAYQLILAAHAHIDMNWMWGWEETVASTIATFQTMLNLMDEYPDFCFSQSQASVYKIIEDYAPELMPQMKKRIQEGRWEVTASAWVETDKNMPSTESLINHIDYTRRYLHKHWGVEPATLDLDFSPDTFGHSANVPEINRFGGVKYYYHCRGLDGNQALYRWKAPSGNEVLVYREQYWYNSGITPLPAIGLIDVAKRSGGLKTGLVVYGVGDHGGGPTRRDLERALEMQNWPVFPGIQFGTFHDYFYAAEKVKDNLPIVEHELNFIFPGCYTTQSRIKMGNRKAEAALFEAQGWNALATQTLGMPYLQDQFESAWQSVLFSHFHDILTGSCVQESREHAMGQFAHAMAVAGSRESLAMQQITRAIDTSVISMDECYEDTQSEGAGAGYGLPAFSGVPAPERGRGITRLFHLFNASAHDRNDVCEITVWDWTGDLRYLKIEDYKGNDLAFQLLDHSLQQYWDHKFFRVLVQTHVPAFGYTTIVLKEKEIEEYAIYLQPEERSNKPHQNFVLENGYIRAEFDFRNGSLISLQDKESGNELLRSGETGGLRYVLTEHDSSNAWQIGRYLSVSDEFETIKLSGIGGPLRNGFEMQQKIKNSIVKTQITLEQEAKAFTVKYEIDWHEISRDRDSVPLLIYYLPLTEVRQYLYDVPAGACYRKPMQLDVPGLQYGAAVREDDRCVMLVTDSKYGYRGADQNLIATLINATMSPDPYPERGIHHITLHIGVCRNNPKAAQEMAFDCNHPLRYQSGTVHSGHLALEKALINLESLGAVVSGVINLEDGLGVRVYETCGEDTEVTLTCSKPVVSAELVDLSGHIIPSDIHHLQNAVHLTMKAYSLSMIKIKFK